MNSLMTKLAGNAQYFEDQAPWAQQYKKQGVQPPMAKTCETIIETGLSGGETVVTNGHLLLTNGARVTIRKAGA